MPKPLHDALEKSFKKQGLHGDALNHAVYGTMTNMEKKKKKKQKKQINYIVKN